MLSLFGDVFCLLRSGSGWAGGVTRSVKNLKIFFSLPTPQISEFGNIRRYTYINSEGPMDTTKHVSACGA